MLTESIEVKSKGQIIEGSPFVYEYPADLEEAVTVDGDEKVYKLFIQQRKIRFMDSKRREITGGGLPKQIVEALKAADPAKLAAIAEALGVDLGIN
uniref:Uncharacterized protein n=1 Tax=viral metagenome TaxID=1070528 RepID=A0A6M3IGU3_9ZZZZ